MFLLGSVLERFFAKYVSINSFTETVLRSIQRGEIMRWPASLGQDAADPLRLAATAALERAPVRLRFPPRLAAAGMPVSRPAAVRRGAAPERRTGAPRARSVDGLCALGDHVVSDAARRTARGALSVAFFGMFGPHGPLADAHHRVRARSHAQRGRSHARALRRHLSTIACCCSFTARGRGAADGLRRIVPRPIASRSTSARSSVSALAAVARARPHSRPGKAPLCRRGSPRRHATPRGSQRWSPTISAYRWRSSSSSASGSTYPPNGRWRLGYSREREHAGAARPCSALACGSAITSFGSCSGRSRATNFQRMLPGATEVSNAGCAGSRLRGRRARVGRALVLAPDASDQLQLGARREAGLEHAPRAQPCGRHRAKTSSSIRLRDKPKRVPSKAAA